jgi:hypothetical protein
MKSLQEFYNDKETAANVKKWLHQICEEEVLKKVFNREDVSGFADARDIIDIAFEKMDEMFAPKPKKNTDNEAR